MNVADALWRATRWLRVEHRLTLNALEEKMKTTGPYMLLSDVQDSLKVLDALLKVVDAVPDPGGRDLWPFISGCTQAIAVVERISQRPRSLGAFSRAVEALEEHSEGERRAAAYREVGEAAVQLVDELTRMVRPAEARLKKLRKELASLTVPDEREMKKLDRYQGTLNKYATDQLDVIAKMRELANQKRRAKRGSSFGTAEKPVTAVLRVVK